MKSINTLIEDIYGLFTSPQPFSREAVGAFGQRLADRIANKISEERGAPTLRLSNLGTPCTRKLWYTVHQPEKAEVLPPEARIKFLFGDILEELLLFLAREAGHSVTDEQKEVQINGVVGHIDGLIDDELVDCKSASSLSFDKFAGHLTKEQDSFGYITQLGSYVSALGRKVGHFFAIDKTLGKLTLDTHQYNDVDYSKEVDIRRAILGKAAPPERAFSDRPSGKSGNRELGPVCSYCEFKQTCWPSLRTFSYSNKPKYLTRVVRLPKVDEVVDAVSEEG